MKVFVRNALAATHLSQDDLAEATRAFFQQTEETIMEHPQWAGCEANELERANDGVEKFVMTKLYDRVFAADEVEAAEDEQLTTWMKRLSFLSVEHLSISPEFAQMQPWLSAQQELAKISTYRTPRDKLVCILNCCKRINSALSMASGGGHGADEFFPVLIFVTLQAAPAGLHASLQYIARFRHPSKLVSEAAYYLTNLQSVMSFISNIQPEQLTIEPADYERGLAATHATLEQQRLEAVAAAAAAAAAAAEAAEESSERAAAAAANGGVLTTPTSCRQRAIMGASPSAAEPPTPMALASTAAGAAGATGAAGAAGMAGAAGGAALTPKGSPGLRAAAAAIPAAVSVSLRVQITDGSIEGGGDGGGGSAPPSPPPSPRVRLVLRAVSLAALRKQQMVEALSAELGWCGPPPSLRFLETRSVVELTVGEVADLLEEFKWLSRWSKTFPPQHLS